MLLFPPPPPPAAPLPIPSPEDLDPLGVEGAGLLGVLEVDGVPPDLLALASSAAFWLLRPNGDMAAADGRFEAGDGIAPRHNVSRQHEVARNERKRVVL